jgi:hypothetical protein
MRVRSHGTPRVSVTLDAAALARARSELHVSPFKADEDLDELSLRGVAGLILARMC